MKGKIAYIIFVLVLLILMYFVNSSVPKSYRWTPTYSRNDKQPFGSYAFDEIMKDSWEKAYIHTYKSVNRLFIDEELTDQNILIVTESFSSTEDEIKKLLDYISNGNQVLISADYFDPILMDTLDFDYNHNYMFSGYINKNIRETNAHLSFCNEKLEKKEFEFPAVNISSFFEDVNDKRDVKVIVKDEQERPVMLRYKIGKGNLILSCNPKIFTNYGILDEKSNGFIWNSLGYLSGSSLIRTEFYHAGLSETESPFRFLIENSPLRWAFYLTLITILLFMIFTAKRKQKAIPVIKEPENRMLKFVRSIAALYLRKNNNNDIVYKKYIYWADQLKKEHGIDIINTTHDSYFYSEFSNKTAIPIDKVKTLFRRLDALDNESRIPDSEMMDLILQMKKIK